MSLLHWLRNRGGSPSPAVEDPMVLRVTHSVTDTGATVAELSLRSSGRELAAASAYVQPCMDSVDSEEVRWYFEERHPIRDGFSERTERIEARLREVGIQLGLDLLGRTPDSRRIWKLVRYRCRELRVEIDSRMPGAARFPWELMANPESGNPLALNVREFVRIAEPSLSDHESGCGSPLRVLLVISRPDGQHDVPLRAVAHALVQRFGRERDESVRVITLRPPTFVRLENALRTACDEGRPFDAVHFDGHGNVDVGSGEPSVTFGDGERVGPETLAGLLARCGVRWLTLNACRSAFAMQQADAGYRAEPAPHTWGAGAAEAASSFAERAIACGLRGVVAMRYNTFVPTAALFVAGMYEQLARGDRLGTAVTRARQALLQAAAQPELMIAQADWFLPVIIEAGMPDAGVGCVPQSYASPAHGGTPLPAILAIPDPMAVGREDLFIQLERAFERPGVVVLHGILGDGRTTIARDFADWYYASGGVECPVIFTTASGFAGLAGWIATVRAEVEPFAGSHASLPGDPASLRRLGVPETVIHLIGMLSAARVFLVIDDVDHATGSSKIYDAWGHDDLRHFSLMLDELAAVGVRVLLVSCGEEREIDPGITFKRVTIWSLVLPDALFVARAIALKAQVPLEILMDVWPALLWSSGHPVSVAWHLRRLQKQGIQVPMRMMDVPLKIGGGAFVPQSASDFAIAGRIERLLRTLAPEQIEIVALLHLPLGEVHCTMLYNIVLHLALPFRTHGGDRHDPNSDDDAYVKLMDRAAAAGLMRLRRRREDRPGVNPGEKKEVGKGHYTIPTIVSMAFEALFEQYYPPGTLKREGALKAYVSSIALDAGYASAVYDDGERFGFNALDSGHENMLRAFELALEYDWWAQARDLMQGFHVLYDTHSRLDRWHELMDAFRPCVEACEGSPKPGREEEWMLLQHWLADRARREGRIGEALGMFSICVEWVRDLVARSSDRDGENGPSSWHRAVGWLITELQHRGRIRMECGARECLHDFMESDMWCMRIGDDCARSVTVGLLARYHTGVTFPEACNPDLAEHYCGQWEAAIKACGRSQARERRRVYQENDQYQLAIVHLQRSIIATRRAWQAARDGIPEQNQRALEKARSEAESGLDIAAKANMLTPDFEAKLLNQLGTVSAWTGDIVKAQQYWEQAAGLAMQAHDCALARMIAENLAQLFMVVGDDVASAEYARLADQLMRRAERGEC
ncbi:MAG: CHAT domain-containing protein [Bacteroidetes bacterium]|nr:CHAT domain-containing protein [Bacteroidota bacterium]